jgi:hypothetical protein
MFVKSTTKKKKPFLSYMNKILAPRARFERALLSQTSASKAGRLGHSRIWANKLPSYH